MCVGRKLVGLLMTATGVGMLIVLFIPQWGFISAVILVLCGIWLFMNA